MSLPARKVWLPLCLAVLALPATAARASAATLYVDALRGADSNPGTALLPFKTIGKAAGAARSGDTVLVSSGRYPETVTLTAGDSGVTFRGTGVTQPIVDGGGSRQYGFDLRHTVGTTVDNFEVTGQTNTGVSVWGSGNVISNDLVHGVGKVGQVQSVGIGVTGGSGNSVTNDQVHSIGPGALSTGILIAQTRQAVVDGNTVWLVRKEAIRDFEGLNNTITSNRTLLSWGGIALQVSTGAYIANNDVYDNTNGLIVKHVSFKTVTDYWGLTAPKLSRLWHNTMYGNTQAAIGIGLNGDPTDYVNAADNLIVGGGYTAVQDDPALRGPHVSLDGDVYDIEGQRPASLYKDGWPNTSPAPITSWSTYVNTVGWEHHGRQTANASLNNPGIGDLDYLDTSPLAAGSLALSDSYGSQLGARHVFPAPVIWTEYPMTPIDSSSKNTWWTTHHLADISDDNQGTYWKTATAANEYVTFDFGSLRTFNTIIVTPQGDYSPLTPHGYVFQSSNNGSTWTTVTSGVNPDDGGASFKYELPTPVTARYLRYKLVDTSCASYSPRTNCGAYFDVGDVAAGLVAPAP